MATETSLKLKFDGPALDNHQMDVDDFAKSLMSLSTVFENINKSVNNNDASTNLKIKATNPGSFEILLNLTQTISSQLSAIDVGSVITIKDYAIEIIDTIKWLKGDKVKSVNKVSEFDMEIEKADGSKIKVKKSVVKMLENPEIRKGIKGLISPLEKEGIEKAQISDDKKELTSISEQEKKFFIPPPVKDTEEILKKEEEGWFKVLSPDFRQGNKWTVSDGNNTIYVSLEDINFINQVQNQEVPLYKEDMLFCKYTRYQYHDSDGKLKTEYTITEVQDFRSGVKQLDILK